MDVDDAGSDGDDTPSPDAADAAGTSEQMNPSAGSALARRVQLEKRIATAPRCDAPLPVAPQPPSATTEEEKAAEVTMHPEQKSAAALARYHSKPSGPLAPPPGTRIVTKFGGVWYKGRLTWSKEHRARAIYEDDGEEEDISFPDADVRVVLAPGSATPAPMPAVKAAAPSRSSRAGSLQ